MRENQVRKALREGRVAIGQNIIEFNTRGLAKMTEYADLDYVMLDLEDGTYTLDRITDMVAWFKATQVELFVRIAKEYIHLIPAFLDQGVMGIQVSNIETADEARALVHEAKYPPLGNRGLALHGMNTDYLDVSAVEFLPWANNQTMVAAAMESPKGVENVDAIAAVEGIDIINIGPSDLSHRMGIHRQLDHPRFKEVLRTVAQACKKHGKAGRGFPQSDAQIKEYYDLGFRIFGLRQTDITLYRDGLKAAADHVRNRLGQIGSSATER